MFSEREKVTLPRVRVAAMQDLQATLEKPLVEAENCDFIANLATTVPKRELFNRLAADLRSSAREIEILLARQTQGGSD